MNYVDVILPLPLDGCFTYLLPDDIAHFAVTAGMRVVVPLGRSKKYVGIVAEVHGRTPDFEVKPIEQVLDEKPVLLPGQLRLWRWIADYYMSPIGEVMNAALPMGLKVRGAYKPKTETYVGLAAPYRSEREMHIALDMLTRAQKQQKVLVDFLAMTHWDEAVAADDPEKGGGDGGIVVQELTREELINESHCTANIVKQLVDRKILFLYEKEVGRLNHGGEPHLERIKQLSEPQAEAYNQILFQFMSKQVVLLHGVTSSGKTEIYIHLIRRALERGEQVLYLLPEIALTVQMRERLQRIFGNRLGIYHSKYSDAERVEIWQKQLSANPYDVILGARSAVLLPFRRLGLVIVDEEHETSFKQQDPAPRYHARSVAIMLAAMTGKEVNVLLGTATPSMESYFFSVPGML